MLGLRLFNREDLVGRNIGEPLNDAAWPGDLNLFYDIVGTQSKVNARVAGACVANGGRRLVPLRAAIGCGDLNLRSNAHVVATPAHEAQQKPILSYGADVAEELEGLVEAADDGIDAPGVEDVAEGCAAMRAGDLETGAGAGTHVLKLAVAEIAEDGVGFRVGLGRNGLLDVVHDICARDEEVLPSVIVEVVSAFAPPRHAVGELAEAAGVVRVYEDAAALVDVEREAFVFDGVVPDVGQSIVIDVAEVGAHARESIAIRRVSDARGDGDLFELLSANIAEEKVGHGVVGDKGIEKSIAVEISKRDTHALAKEGIYAGFMRDISECAITVVAIESVVERLIEIGMTVGAQAFFERAIRVLVDLPMAVVNDKKVKQSIVVVVEPACANRPHLLAMSVRTGDAGFRGDISEGAVAIIAEELVAGDIRDEDVGIAIVVEIPDSHSHSVPSSSDAGLFCHVGEGAVVIVAEEPVPVGGRGLLERGYFRAVNAVDVKETIVVVVEQRDAGHHSLGLVLIRRGTVSGNEAKAGLFGDFIEANSGSGRSCGGLRGKRPEPARRERGCCDEAKRLEEAATLRSRDWIDGHGCVRGCVVTAKSTCSPRASGSRPAPSRTSHYCYRTPDHRIPDGMRENAL